MSRGIRNNNPGNIRHKDAWDGMADIQGDDSFVTFISPVWGIRAMIKVLLTYSRKYKLDTVRGIISRWAPPSENDTDEYIQFVCDRMDVCNIDRLNMTAPHILIGLAKAITIFENDPAPEGSPREWYLHEMWENGFKEATKG